MSIVDPDKKKKKKKLVNSTSVKNVVKFFIERSLYYVSSILYIYIYIYVYIYIYIDTLIRDFLKNRLSYYNYVIYWYYYKFTTKGGVISTQNKKGNKF